MKLKDLDFRIWDKGEKTLTYASKDWKLSIGFSNPQQDYGVCESVLHAYYDGEPLCPDDCEIELWSGLCDKNGKKIYEGDIVKHKHTSGKVVVVRNTFYILKSEYNNNSNTNNGYIDNDNTLESVEVIGNTHESKE